MVFAPVGIRCPEHSGQPAGPARVRRTVQRATFESHGAYVTRILVAINIVVYLITVAQGRGINDPGGSLFIKWLLYGPAVAHGDWWRLMTAAFLHANVLHIAFNMWALAWLGPPVELALGRGRFLALYIVSGLAGSAGALIDNPNAVTVGASGAIFGILGAGMVLEWLATGSFAGQYAGLIALNLILNFGLNAGGGNIAIGGHIGGLIAGVAGTLVLAKFGRGHPAYSRLGLTGMGGIAAIGAISVVIAYWAA
jgi:membrane associated rhomboid family serine protease